MVNSLGRQGAYSDEVSKMRKSMKNLLVVFVCLGCVDQVLGMGKHHIVSDEGKGPLVITGPRHFTTDEQARMELQRFEEERQKQSQTSGNNGHNGFNEPLSTSNNTSKNSVITHVLSANPDVADPDANHLTSIELEKLKKINEREKNFSFFKRLFPRRSFDDKKVIGNVKKIITERVNSLIGDLSSNDALALYKEDSSVGKQVNNLKQNVINAKKNVQEGLKKSNSIVGRKATL